MEQNYKQFRKDSLLSDRPVRDSSAPRAVLASLFELAKRSNANSVNFHIQDYSNDRPEGTSVDLSFNISGRLEPVAKKFSNKILLEIVDFIKDYSNLEKNPLKQVQVANLSIPGLTACRVILINSPQGSAALSQLVLEFSGSSTDNKSSLQDLGLSHKEVSEYKSALSKKKGIIVVNSNGLILAQTFILNSLKLLESSSPSILVFDANSIYWNKSSYSNSSLRFSLVSTPLNAENISIAKNALLSNPSVVIFGECANPQTIDLAIQLANCGKLVFITTSESSAVSGLIKFQNLSATGNSETISFMQEVITSISLRPIKSIASSSLDHTLSPDLVENISHFFGVDNLKVWNKLLGLSNQPKVTDPVDLKFPKVASYGSWTSLIEILYVSPELKKTLMSDSNPTEELLTWRAIRSGMATSRHNGLVRALNGELDIADVIEACQ